MSFSPESMSPMSTFGPCQLKRPPRNLSNSRVDAKGNTNHYHRRRRERFNASVYSESGSSWSAGSHLRLHHKHPCTANNSQFKIGLIANEMPLTWMTELSFEQAKNCLSLEVRGGYKQDIGTEVGYYACNCFSHLSIFSSFMT